VVQWCYDAVSPPLVAEVSDPIPAPGGTGRFCYVIHVPESDVAPHFLNGRKGVWVRTDEFSQRIGLANEGEFRHLLDRRRLVRERRRESCQRSHARFEQFVYHAVVESQRSTKGAHLELTLGPRFPARPLCTHTVLVAAFKNCSISWRGSCFPALRASLVTQHESALSLALGETEMMVEATIWGMLFYGAGLIIERGGGRGSAQGSTVPMSLPFHALRRMQAYARLSESEDPPCLRLTIWSI
jgi:hypothetical protein